MTNELDQATGGGIGLAFILSELRDLRKGMETRDENLRGSIDSVRDSVNVLGAKVDRSQGDVDKAGVELKNLREEVGGVRKDVDSILQDRTTDKIKKESAWSGPAKVLRIVALIGVAATGTLAVIKFWPALVVLFPSLVAAVQ